jgi:hypothetical protein
VENLLSIVDSYAKGQKSNQYESIEKTFSTTVLELIHQGPTTYTDVVQE